MGSKYGFYLEDSDSPNFRDWRLKMNGSNDSNMTKIEQALNNIETALTDGNGIFLINVSFQTAYTIDRTFDELLAAKAENKILVLYFESAQYFVSSFKENVSDGMLTFLFNKIYIENKSVCEDWFRISGKPGSNTRIEHLEENYGLISNDLFNINIKTLSPYTIDKTYEEILTAYKDGKILRLINGTSQYNYMNYVQSSETFTFYRIYGLGATSLIREVFTIKKSGNDVLISMKMYDHTTPNVDPSSTFYIRITKTNPYTIDRNYDEVMEAFRKGKDFILIDGYYQYRLIAMRENGDNTALFMIFVSIEHTMQNTISETRYTIAVSSVNKSVVQREINEVTADPPFVIESVYENGVEKSNHTAGEILQVSKDSPIYIKDGTVIVETMVKGSGSDYVVLQSVPVVVNSGNDFCKFVWVTYTIKNDRTITMSTETVPASAYLAAKSGGYNGTEDSFNKDLAGLQGLSSWLASF